MKAFRVTDNKGNVSIIKADYMELNEEHGVIIIYKFDDFGLKKAVGYYPTGYTIELLEDESI